MEHLIGKLLQDFDQGKMTRRQLIQSLALVTAAPLAVSAARAAASDSRVIQAVDLNHISYQVADYAKTRDFYADLFGMKVANDDAKRKQCRLLVGESIIVVRTQPSNTPRVDHICFTLANWDTDKNVRAAVETELKHHGLEVKEGNRSLVIKDPDGLGVQIGGKDQ
jgi:catechol 2,3-dioxygenase-like lactoylglutathione lyase family enzyme